MASLSGQLPGCKPLKIMAPKANNDCQFHSSDPGPSTWRQILPLDLQSTPLILSQDHRMRGSCYIGCSTTTVVTYFELFGGDYGGHRKCNELGVTNPEFGE